VVPVGTGLKFFALEPEYAEAEVAQKLKLFAGKGEQEERERRGWGPILTSPATLDKKERTLGCFCWNCNGRSISFYQKPHVTTLKISEVFGNRVPVVGMLCGGEILPYKAHMFESLEGKKPVPF
jgi:hypothetical protein